MLQPQTETVSDNRFDPIVKNGINVYQHNTARQAIDYAYLLLSQIVTRRSVLFLSHANELAELVDYFCRYEKIEPGVVVMCEEMMGEAFHWQSCELKYQECGFMEAMSKRSVPFFRILARSPSLTGTTRVYSARIDEVLQTVENSHGVWAMGADGSLGGITPVGEEGIEFFSAQGPMFKDLVVGYRGDQYGPLGRKVTVSLKLINQLSHVWIFALGEDKKPLLRKLLSSGNDKYHACPAYYLQQLPGRVHLFTDQQVV